MEKHANWIPYNNFAMLYSLGAWKNAMRPANKQTNLHNVGHTHTHKNTRTHTSAQSYTHVQQEKESNN